MDLTKLSLQRPIFIFVIMIVTVLAGLVSYNSMRVELNPEVNFGVVSVQTTYPGADPDAMNNLVTRRIENAVSGVNGIREVTGNSREGISIVVINFELGTNIDNAVNDVRTRVDGILDTLPREANKPTISKQDSAASPVFTVGVSSTKLDPKALRDLIDDKIRDQFSRIPGVGLVSVDGGQEREIKVEVKKDQLLAYGIGIGAISQQLSAASGNIPAGSIRTGDQEFSVRTPAEFTDADQIREMIISVQNPNDRNAKSVNVRLGDIADVTDGAKERTVFTRLNGSETILMNISKARDGNAVEVSQLATEVIKKLQTQYEADGLTFVKSLDESIQTKESIDDVIFSIILGIILVSIIVYVFLHDFRGTLIVAIAIPTSIFAAFIFLKAFGFTINTLSMLSLSLAIGVLVDDAIVVLENIYRHLKMGEDPVTAAYNGRREIGVAAIAITLADVVVFLPIAFMGGIVGQFYKPLALGYVATVLFSLFVSFTLTPLLASRWYKKGEDFENPKGWFAPWFERGFAKFENGYRRTLSWSIKHRWFVFISGNLVLVAVIVFIIGSTGGGFLAGLPLLYVCLAVGFLVMFGNALRGNFNLKYVAYGAMFGLLFPVSGALGKIFGDWKQEAVFKFQFIPATDAGRLSIRIELPPGAALSKTDEVVRRVEAVAGAHPDVHYVVSTIGEQPGSGQGIGTSGSNYAQVAITLYEKMAPSDYFPWSKSSEKLRTRKDTLVAGDITKKIGKVAGASIAVSAQDSFSFGSAIQISLSGDDSKALSKSAQKIQVALKEGKIPGVINPTLSTKPGKPELQAVPDRVRIADAGIDVATVGGALRTLYNGNNDAKLRVNGREWDIRVQLSETDRQNPNILNEIPVAFEQGKPLYLGSLVDLKQTSALDVINRRGRVEEIQVAADLLPGFAAGTVQAAIDDWIVKEKLLEPGVTNKALGQADAQAREGVFILGAFAAGIIGVYFLLASLFNNWLYPAIIQLAQPQAMVGALLGLIILDKAFSVIGVIGVVALVGQVSKNAILLVDYTNTLRSRGRKRLDAILEAGPARLRPIIMTTLALVLGTLPVALAIGRGSEFRETIGITIVGGTLLSTVLTLLVIPCSYTIFDDIASWIMTKLGKSPPFSDTPEAESLESVPSPATVT